MVHDSPPETTKEINMENHPNQPRIMRVELTERERRAAHRLLHRVRTGKRTPTDALLGALGLRLGVKG